MHSNALYHCIKPFGLIQVQPALSKARVVHQSDIGSDTVALLSTVNVCVTLFVVVIKYIKLILLNQLTPILNNFSCDFFLCLYCWSIVESIAQITFSTFDCKVSHPKTLKDHKRLARDSFPIVLLSVYRICCCIFYSHFLF